MCGARGADGVRARRRSDARPRSGSQRDLRRASGDGAGGVIAGLDGAVATLPSMWRPMRPALLLGGVRCV